MLSCAGAFSFVYWQWLVLWRQRRLDYWLFVEMIKTNMICIKYVWQCGLTHDGCPPALVVCKIMDWCWCWALSLVSADVFTVWIYMSELSIHISFLIGAWLYCHCHHHITNAFSDTVYDVTLDVYSLRLILLSWLAAPFNMCQSVHSSNKHNGEFSGQIIWSTS